MKVLCGVVVLVVGMLAVLPQACGDSFQQIPITAIATDVLADYYLVPPCGDFVFDGVPFHIPDEGNNVFFTQDYGHGSDNPTTGTIAADVGMPSVAHVLVTGTAVLEEFAGAVTGNIVFGYQDGSSYVVPLIPGDNIRDWVTRSERIVTTTSPQVSTVWVGQTQAYWQYREAVVNMLSVPIPGVSRLTSITFNDTSLSAVGNTAPGMFFYGVTVELIPEPSGLLVLASALGGFGATVLRRRQGTATSCGFHSR